MQTESIKFAVHLFVCLSVYVCVWDASPPKLLNGVGQNFAQGRRSVPDTVSHFVGHRARGPARGPPREPKMYRGEILCQSCTDHLLYYLIACYIVLLWFVNVTISVQLWQIKQAVPLGGRRNIPPPRDLTFDLLTLKSVWESHVPKCWESMHLSSGDPDLYKYFQVSNRCFMLQ